MTSIHTNPSGMTALTIMRRTDAALLRAQNEAATGMRVSEASHNAAYWSISTSMRSSLKALSVVGDALGLGAATVDVAYAGMTQTVDILKDVKARLVAAVANPEQAAAIQGEIAQLADQTRSIASSASFAGSNWLSTDIADIFDAEALDRSTSVITSYSKSSSGESRLGTMSVDLGLTSLYNVDGGGILQADPRSPGTIGGIRYHLPETGGMSTTNLRAGARAMQVFDFTGPVDLSSGGQISFTVTVDRDSPSLPQPHHDGSSSAVVIDSALVQSVYPGSGGIIATYEQMAAVLSAAMSGTGASATLLSDWEGNVIPDRFAILTRESSGLDGSSVAISDLEGAAGGLSEFERFGSRGSSISLAFSAFKVYEDVEISFSFHVNGQSQDVLLDRNAVDSILGRDDGRVDSPEDLAAVLSSLVGQPGLVIEAGASAVTLMTDDTDRLWGAKSGIGFSGIVVNVEPIPGIGLLDIDVAANPEMAATYIEAVNAMAERAISGAAYLGASKKRIDLQKDFISRLEDSISRGLGQLVDADMEKTAVRLMALQVQRDLVGKALSIANASTGTVLQLFRTN